MRLVVMLYIVAIAIGVAAIVGVHLAGVFAGGWVLGDVQSKLSSLWRDRER